VPQRARRGVFSLRRASLIAAAGVGDGAGALTDTSAAAGVAGATSDAPQWPPLPPRCPDDESDESWDGYSLLLFSKRAWHVPSVCLRFDMHAAIHTRSPTIYERCPSQPPTNSGLSTTSPVLDFTHLERVLTQQLPRGQRVVRLYHGTTLGQAQQLVTQGVMYNHLRHASVAGEFVFVTSDSLHWACREAREAQKQATPSSEARYRQQDDSQAAVIVFDVPQPMFACIDTWRGDGGDSDSETDFDTATRRPVAPLTPRSVPTSTRTSAAPHTELPAPRSEAHATPTTTRSPARAPPNTPLLVVGSTSCLLGVRRVAHHDGAGHAMHGTPRGRGGRSRVVGGERDDDEHCHARAGPSVHTPTPPHHHHHPPRLYLWRARYGQDALWPAGRAGARGAGSGCTAHRGRYTGIYAAASHDDKASIPVPQRHRHRLGAVVTTCWEGDEILEYLDGADTISTPWDAVMAECHTLSPKATQHDADGMTHSATHGSSSMREHEPGYWSYMREYVWYMRGHWKKCERGSRKDDRLVEHASRMATRMRRRMDMLEHTSRGNTHRSSRTRHRSQADGCYPQVWAPHAMCGPYKGDTGLVPLLVSRHVSVSLCRLDMDDVA